jgi:hypothetical protein
MAAWSKRDLLEQAYLEIGKASYDFDLQPEELQSGLRALDAMVATWANKGVLIGWAGGDGFGDVDALSNVPEYAMEAIYLNLALRLAPSFGKAVSPDTRAAAKNAFDIVLSRSIVPVDKRITGYAGSGNRNGVTAWPVSLT